jgi:hypothetical protein
MTLSNGTAIIVNGTTGVPLGLLPAEEHHIAVKSAACLKK